MKSVEISEKKIGQGLNLKSDIENSLDGSWLDQFCRKVVLSTLAKIKRGHLSLEENGHVCSFGEDPTSTEINAHISVNDISVYRTVLFRGTIGSGEAYMTNAWWSPDLVQVIRVFVANMDVIKNMDSRWSTIYKFLGSIAHRFRHNDKEKARQNISAHYDLGNDFFSLFLDKHRLYSSAIYPENCRDLEQASEYKLAHICKRLQLDSDDHLLEIGTGWGGMAVYAAKNTGCKVTSVTISKEQYEYAKAWVEKEQLQDLVEIRLQDYRDIRGKFDKIVSIEMVEAVGYQYYSQFFSSCSKLLKENGLMLMQAITIADQRYDRERDRADFIQTYIFPGGCLPSNEIISKHIAEDTNMQIVGLEDMTLDYAKTLAEWRRRFFANIEQVQQQGFDDIFIRMWDFYLSYCEGGFRERVISTAQFMFAKPHYRQLRSL